MSRTDKTAPLHVQEADGRRWMRDNGGLWRGIKDLRRRYNRSDRYRARRQLRDGEDVEPRQPRGRAKWDLY